jgi:hypothetical protein
MLELSDLNRRFSHPTLPSGGKFYHNKCKKVKLFHLEANDVSVLTDRNLLQSGDMIDVLMKRKVTKADDESVFIDPSQMLTGDREALVVMLRIHMEPIFHIPLNDPVSDKTFIHPFDLTTLQTKKINVLPDEENLFSYTLKKSFQRNGEYEDVEVKFRLMTCADEAWIRLQQRKDPQQKNNFMILKLKRIIKSIGGNEDERFISAFLNQADMNEIIDLQRFTNKVMPGLDMTGVATSPGGEMVPFTVPFLPSFLLPSIQ